MKQVQVHKYGGPEVLQILDTYEPRPGDWELLIRVKYASANPKDVLLRKGKLKAYLSIAFPITLGQDFSGVVERVGKKVKKFRPGDEVYGMTNRHNNGTLSEYIIAAPNEICLKPMNLSFAEAAAIPLTAQTALQAIKDVARVKSGHRVLINGASGGVGTFAIQIASILGARVTAVSSEKNREICLELGADEHLDYHSFSFAGHQAEYDLFFDVYGNQERNKVRHLLGQNGWYITTVPNWKNILDTLLSYFKLRRSRLIVVESYHDDLQLLKHWIEDNRLKPVIAAEYDLYEIAEVHRQLETRRTVGKIVVKVSQ